MMLLQEIKVYLQRRQVVSLFDLKREFGTDAEILRDMLNLWVQKGKVRCLQKTSACGTRCTQCDPLFTERYEWISVSASSCPEAVIQWPRSVGCPKTVD